ncbi:MAG: hypothetical protein QOE97_3705 [Pseudonocardiales bacterium]|nr:hypothetical protein [Pseudonocardiales bacterium]
MQAIAVSSDASIDRVLRMLDRTQASRCVSG